MVMSAANDYSTLVTKEAPEKKVDTEKKVNVRKRVLNAADECVNGDRNVAYGDPTEDFQRTAAYWNTHLKGVLSRKVMGNLDDVHPAIKYALDNLIDTWDVAIMMNLLKISRLSWSPTKEDHWIDAAGYAACGAECVDTHMNGHDS